MSNRTTEIGNLHLEGQIKLLKQETSPIGEVDSGKIYAKEEEDESTAIYALDSAGNETKLSSHNEEGEWVYFSQNIKTGKKVKINMEKMIRKLEQITGESFFEEYIEAK
tara:strand:- start:118 stop:444 length:327 start_codon:yes stop_codon:yes gene_type:complete